MAFGGSIKAAAAYVSLEMRDNKFLRDLSFVQRKFRNAARDMALLGRSLFIFGGAAAAPIGAAVKRFVDFDDAIRTVAAVTKTTGTPAFKELEKTAKELGRTTSFTAVEVAQLMTVLGRAGFAAGEINKMTSAVLDLARATDTDTQTASQVMSATIRQFGFAAEDATALAGGLTAAVNGSNQTLQQLQESFNYSGPVAADLGLTIQETLALTGVLGDLGIRGSLAGTAVRRLGVISAAESENIKKLTGVTTGDVNGDLRPLVDILDEVIQATDDLGSTDRAKVLNEVFGIRGITAASGLGKNASSVKELISEIEDGAKNNLAGKTAKEIDAGLGGAFRRLLSALEGFGLAFVTSFEKPLKRAVDAGTKALRQLALFTEQNPQFLKYIAAAVLSVPLLGAALLGLSAALMTVVVSMGAVILIFKALVTVATVTRSILVAVNSAALIGRGATMLMSGAYVVLTSAMSAANAVMALTKAALIAINIQTVLLYAKTIAASIATKLLSKSIVALRVVYALTAIAVVGLSNAMVAGKAIIAAYRATVVALQTALFVLEALFTLSVIAIKRFNIVTAVSTALTKAFKAAMAATAIVVSTVRAAIIASVIATRTFIVTLTLAKVASYALRAALVAERIVVYLLVASFAALRASAVLMTLTFAALRAGAITLSAIYAALRGGVLALRAAFVALKVSMIAASAATAIASLFSFILSPAGALIVAIGLLVAAFMNWGANTDEIVKWIMKRFGNLFSVTKETFVAIAKLIGSGDVKAAAKLFWLYLKFAWLEGTNELSKIWVSFQSEFLKTWNFTIAEIAKKFINIKAYLESLYQTGLKNAREADITMAHRAREKEIFKQYRKAKAALDPDDMQGQADLDDELSKNLRANKARKKQEIGGAASALDKIEENRKSAIAIIDSDAEEKANRLEAIANRRRDDVQMKIDAAEKELRNALKLANEAEPPGDPGDPQTNGLPGRGDQQPGSGLKNLEGIRSVGTFLGGAAAQLSASGVSREKGPEDIIAELRAARKERLEERRLIKKQQRIWERNHKLGLDNDAKLNEFLSGVRSA